VRLLALGVTITYFLSIEAWAQRPPTSPNAPWIPTDHLLERYETAVAPHEVSIDAEHVYSLGELIDIAESNNPTTQAAWNRAKSTAASVGIAKSDLYPMIIATVSGTTYLNPQLFGPTFVLQDWAIFDGAASGLHARGLRCATHGDYRR
jgi:outer membrane protein